MAFAIKYSEAAIADLRKLAARWRARILDEVDAQLTHEPTKPSKSRKSIDLTPPSEIIEAIQPFWQLRVEVFRVFYNVDEEAGEVHIWGVRAKGPGRTTFEVLHGRRTDEDDESE